MPKFTSKTAADAGRKSRRGQDVLTKQIRENIAKVIAGRTKTLEKDLDAMSEKERWAVIIGLSEFAIPRLARMEHDITTGGDKISNELSGFTFEQLMELKYGRKPK